MKNEFESEEWQKRREGHPDSENNLKWFHSRVKHPDVLEIIGAWKVGQFQNWNAYYHSLGMELKPEELPKIITYTGVDSRFDDSFGKITAINFGWMDCKFRRFYHPINIHQDWDLFRKELEWVFNEAKKLSNLST